MGRWLQAVAVSSNYEPLCASQEVLSSLVGGQLRSEGLNSQQGLEKEVETENLNDP